MMPMSETASDDHERWVTITGTPKLYHITKECSRVRKPEQYRDRDTSYIEFHEIDPCPFCHPDLDRPIDGDPSEG